MCMTPDRPPTSQRGDWLVRLGVAVIAAAFVWAVVASVRAWGETTSVALLATVVIGWVGSILVTQGMVLRGQLTPGQVLSRRALLALPIGVAVAYFGPAIEHFGSWWVLLLPHHTYSLLAGAGLPHWPALVVTIALGVPEVLLAVMVTQIAIVSPLSFALGPDHPIVEDVRGMVGGFRFELSDGPGA